MVGSGTLARTEEINSLVHKGLGAPKTPSILQMLDFPLLYMLFPSGYETNAAKKAALIDRFLGS